MPVVELATFTLLNAGLLAKTAYAGTLEPRLALVSGPLTGIAIVAFLLNMQMRLRKMA